MNYGATQTEWDHFSLILGLTRDMLPVVSNPHAKISPDSKMKGIGKTPSQYNRAGHVAGIAKWTQYNASSGDVSRWREHPDYGVCIQTRLVRALDVDVDHNIAGDIEHEITTFLGNLGIAAPTRRRAGTRKFLVLLVVEGALSKRILHTEHGNIEFLADGQQFVAAGTHPSGHRYQWEGDLPDSIPTLPAEAFEQLWRRLEVCFAIEPSTQVSPSAVVDRKKAIHNDPTAQRLHDKGLVLSAERDGRLHIVCPFAAEHTSASDDSATTYLPPVAGRFERGRFHCLHSHCVGRTEAEFLTALGLPDPTIDDFEVLTPAPVEEKKSTGERYVFEPISVFKKRRPPTWIVRSIIPEAALAVIFGESGSGKTFYATDIGMCIARGVQWRGFDVKQGTVAYIAAEDARGVQMRVQAHQQHYGVPDEVPFYMLSESPNFTKGEDMRDILKALRVIGDVSIVFVDTWAQVTPGADENSGADMGKALNYCKQLHKATGALVVLIHHSGKDASKGARGWSGLRAAADCEIEITRCDNARQAQVTKLKNAADGARFGFKLVPVVVFTDGDEDITSCVIEHTESLVDKSKDVQTQPALNVKRWFMENMDGNNSLSLADLTEVGRKEFAALGRRNVAREVDKGYKALVAAGFFTLDNGILTRVGEAE